MKKSIAEKGWYQRNFRDATFGTAAWNMKSVNVAEVKFVKLTCIVVSWGFPGCFLKLKVIFKVALWKAVIGG
jgi:hypothetical protein